MSLKDLISNESIVVCQLNEKVDRIAKKMTTNNVGSVIVMKGEEPVGLITDRDIVTRCIANIGDASECRAKDIMSSPVHKITQDCSVFDAVSTMREKECRRIVLTDKKGGIVGVISSGDIMELLVRELNLLAWVTTPHEQKLFKSKVA